MSTNNYDAASITVLKGLEAVRIRPAMFIGDTDKKGLHHLALETLDNSVDEALAGFCNQINVTLHADEETLTVEDNGRGIPVDIHPDYIKEKKTALEVIMTILHAGGKFSNDNYAGGSGGLHGVGISCVNALSDKLSVKVWRDGGTYEQSYSRGIPEGPCIKTGDSKKRGTSVTFHADSEIFIRTIKFDEDTLLKKLREMAFLNAGLKIIYSNKKINRTEEFHYDGGIRDYISYQTKSKNGHYPETPFFYKNTINDCAVQIAFQYTEEDDELLLSFANNICTVDGGTHASGFKTALTRIVNQFGRSLSILKPNANNLSGDDIREGITAIVSVRLPQPQFEGQTKAKLGSVEADGAVNSVFGEGLSEYFEKNPAIAKEIIERAMVSQEARAAAKKEADTIKRKSFLGKSNRLPGKLRDCAIEDRARAELFITEGDSAAGAATMGRNASYQAVLPIRGKIINAEKNDLANLLKNTEIQSLIASIGTGIITKNEDDFNLENRRYDKIILTVDADVDGSHIASLLLTFFYRFMRPLIAEGHVYLAQPPLFKIEIGKKISYAWSIEEMTKIAGNGKGRVVRFKGLGEMNASELGITTMDIFNRHLIKVDIEDIADADRMFSILMGHNVAERKAFIVEHSAIRNRDEE